MFYAANAFLSGYDDKRWCQNSATLIDSKQGTETYLKKGQFCSYQEY